MGVAGGEGEVGFFVVWSFEDGVSGVAGPGFTLVGGVGEGLAESPLGEAGDNGRVFGGAEAGGVEVIDGGGTGEDGVVVEGDEGVGVLGPVEEVGGGGVAPFLFADAIVLEEEVVGAVEEEESVGIVEVAGVGGEVETGSEFLLIERWFFGEGELDAEEDEKEFHGMEED